MSFILPALIASKIRNKINNPTGVQKIDSTSHDDFLAKNANTDYADLIRSNPYMSYDYNNSLWDNFGNLFGFNTTEDKLRLQYSQAAKDYDAQVSQLIQENDFNSPSSQASRMRQAGINPDLNGVANNPATEFAQEQTSPDASGVGVGPAEVGNFMMNVVSGAISLYNGFQGIRAQSLDNQGKEISNLIASFGLSNDYAKNLIGVDLDSGSMEFNTPIYPDNVSLATKKIIDANYMIARNSMQNVAAYWNSRKEANKGVKDVYFQEGSKYQPDRFGIDVNAQLNQEDTTLSEFVVPIVEAMDEYFLQDSYNKRDRASLESETIENETIYQQNIDPALQAGAENAAARESRSQSTFNNELNSVIRRSISRLSDKAEQGDSMATALLLSISFLLSQQAQSAFKTFGR